MSERELIMVTADERFLLAILIILALVFLAIFTGLIVKALRSRGAEEVARPQVVVGSSAEKEVETVKPVSVAGALASTQNQIFGRLKNLFRDKTVEAHFSAIEEVLYTSDIGANTVQRLMDSLDKNFSRAEKRDLKLLEGSLRQEFSAIFAEANHSQDPVEDLLSAAEKSGSKPYVVMIVGVNGAGKTTSIGKLSAQLAKAGKKVLVAAGDTFRAAAGEQLKAWTDRAQVEIFTAGDVKDPGAVAFAAVSQAQSQGFDFVLVDTAGRLHTQVNLMEELKKVKRVMGKVMEGAPHEVIIVLDANSGQNALIQAKEFHKALSLTGAILTKMDGTAKGGVAVGLAHELKLPIKYMGVGEKIEDLRSFSAQEYIDSVFS